MVRFNIINKIKTFFALLRSAFNEFQQNDPLRMAAATSFFATFALPPILIILIEIFGFFGNARTIRKDLFDQLGNAIDRNTVSQIPRYIEECTLPAAELVRSSCGFCFFVICSHHFV